MSNAPYIGTAGWSYPHWNGVVYPIGPKSSLHPLELIARNTSTVEINSSFYQTLRPEVTRLWLKKVEHNPDFQFTAKLHQQFTHKRQLIDSEIRAFKDGLRPLQKAGRLGALLMQFPWSYRLTEENRDFFIRLRRAFHDFPLVAEMRHDSWMSEEALGTFLDYKVGFCNIDQPQYTRAMPPTSLLTSGVGYVRLHGRNPGNSLGAFQEGAQRRKQHDYLYSESELSEWAKRIEHVARFAERTFVIFNNDAAGKSFVNALQLEKMMGVLRGPAPINLRRRYPVQLEHFGRNAAPAYGEQQVLFPAA
ncbi:MAG: DUF72 domain-containing protein [Acidobacteriota bacterium]